MVLVSVSCKSPIRVTAPTPLVSTLATLLKENWSVLKSQSWRANMGREKLHLSKVFSISKWKRCANAQSTPFQVGSNGMEESKRSAC